jgi:hypothetical protein
VIVTCQSKKECPDEVKNICKNFGITWFFLELDGANMILMDNKKVKKNMFATIGKVVALMRDSEE